MSGRASGGIAWAAHLYTASGLVAGFLALLAVEVRDFRAAFLWLFVALIVDATDGWLARRLRVAERVPWFSGTRLDDIVDYVTYVFVPAFLLHRADVLPAPAALVVPVLMLLASAYGFAHEQAKTSDHFFTGFPWYWNIVVFYLYAGGLPRWINAAVLIVCCGLVFVRTSYVYPSRTATLRRVTILGGILWCPLVLSMLWALPRRLPGVLLLSLIFPAYYLALSLILDGQRRNRGPAA